MAEAVSNADVRWEGNLADGSGELTTESGVLRGVRVTWPQRVGESRSQPSGETTPEELLAGAHAACYAMSLAHELAQGGHTARQLEVHAAVTFASQVSGGWKVASSALTVRGSAPGLDQAGFEGFARQAEANCPVSNALRGSLEITVRAELVASGGAAGGRRWQPYS